MTEASAGNNDRASNIIIKELMKEYIGEGCILVTENVYDNLDLAQCLIKNKVSSGFQTKCKWCAYGCFSEH